MDVAILILNIIIVLILFFNELWGKPYFNKKAENLANKEDIEELTQKVNNIEKSIDYKTQSTLSLALEERNAMIDCYQKLSVYTEIVINHPPIPFITEELNDDFEIKRNNASNAYDSAVSLLKLYAPNKDILTLLYSQSKSLIELSSKQHKFISEYHKLYFKYKRLYSENKFNEQEYEEYEKERDVILEIYDKESMDIYSKKVLPENEKLVELIRKRIKEILDMDNV